MFMLYMIMNLFILIFSTTLTFYLGYKYGKRVKKWEKNHKICDTKRNNIENITKCNLN
jgi:hypothetical protein